MHPARIAELLEPYLLSPLDQGPKTRLLLSNISTYIDVLLHWNARINLTAIRDPEQIVTRHFGESLFAAQYLLPNDSSAPPVLKNVEVATHERRTNHRVADVGSGAGFPGLPIKLYAPDIDLTLIESNHKKATFLREVVRALNLTGVNVQNARAEILTSTFDLVTLRAVERFAQALPVAAARVAPAGRLALLIGTSQLAAAESALSHISWDSPLPIPRSESRMLCIGHHLRDSSEDHESKHVG
jgi:16S rRNA (guanine527-N7)-methyltransferase